MRWIARNLHFLAAVGAPVKFAFGTGHFLSALKSHAVDQKGKPLPWYTYPSIAFLAQHDFSDADVLEFGGGQSTLWWSGRARSVTCLESDPDWCKKLAKKANDRAEVVHVTSPAHAAQILGDRLFDIIVVDDGSGVGPSGRVANAQTAFPRIRPDEMVIIDNSDADYCRPILEAARHANYNRVDFMGWAPGSLGQSCTTLLFPGSSRFLCYGGPPRMR